MIQQCHLTPEAHALAALAFFVCGVIIGAFITSKVKQ